MKQGGHVGLPKIIYSKFDQVGYAVCLFDGPKSFI